jgi:Zn-dependent peptidase ImmA (M78 family)
MSNFAEILKEEIRIEARAVVTELLKPLEPFRDLPEIATTAEVAAVFRVSKEVLGRMAEDGMPHAHAGRELRFARIRLMEWTMSGKIFPCEICAKKSDKSSGDATQVTQNVFELSHKSTKKLAEIAGGCVK